MEQRVCGLLGIAAGTHIQKEWQDVNTVKNYSPEHHDSIDEQLSKIGKKLF
jgi:hypothetical protein